MKIGAVSLGWGSVPLPTVFQQLSAAGGECVEINGRPGRHDGLILDETTIPQVRSRAEAAGLEIVGLSGYCDFAQSGQAAIDQEIERLMTTCRAAARMKVKFVRAFVGDVKAGLTFEAVRPRIVAAFQRAAQEAAQLGLTLAIENHGRLVNDGPSLVQLLQEIDAPNLGLTLDTGNFCWAGRSVDQAQQDFAAVLPHVVNVHIKDGLWQDDQFELVPAGAGELDIAGLIAQLAAYGYRGAIHSEYEGRDDFLASTRQSIEFLKTARQTALEN